MLPFLSNGEVYHYPGAEVFSLLETVGHVLKGAAASTTMTTVTTSPRSTTTTTTTATTTHNLPTVEISDSGAAPILLSFPLVYCLMLLLR